MSDTLEYVGKEPEYLGKIDQETYKKFVNYQTNISLMQQRIGLVELQKLELVRLIQEDSKKASDLMVDEAKRLKIPEGSDWHITKDGEAYLGKAPETQQQ